MSQDFLSDVSSYSNFIELLEHQVRFNGDKVCFTLLANGSDVSEEISYAELSLRARAISIELKALSNPGDRAMLLMPNGIDYIVGFFGCIYAGLIAVTAYVPQQRRRDWGRLNGILEDSESSLVLCSADHEEQVANWLMDSQRDCHQFILGQETLSLAGQWEMPSIDRSSVAYLQYSSGSTGSPKGVMLGHGNLIHNTSLIVQEFALDSSSNVVTWLPMYHDMGFVGGVLSAINVGASVCLLPPPVVLQAPFLWLKAISDYKAIVSGGPNFIYEHCVARISEEQKQELDLSHWRFAGNGAEPIHAATLARFTQNFAACGLSASALKPCYGMAEACLFVTATAHDEAYRSVELDKLALQKGWLVRPEKTVAGQGQSDALVRVPSSGRVNSQMAIRIVDPVTKQALGSDRVGEIWISGDSVAQGYWNKPDITAEAFGNEIVANSLNEKVLNEKAENKKADCEGQYLRTGDLGFVLDGWLYVSGRAKEMVIVNGCNHYPQDIEATVQTVDNDLAPHGGAVFETADSKVVVVQELTRQGVRRKDLEQVILEIRQTVAEVHEISLSAVVLLKPVSLAKTTSGKIQRLKNCDLYSQGALNVVQQWRADDEKVKANEVQVFDEPELIVGDENSISDWICYWIASRLQVTVADVNPKQKLVATGLDSIDSMTLTHELSQRLNIELTAELVWKYPTTEMLAAFLASAQNDVIHNDEAIKSDKQEEESLLEGEI